jgi:uncharacterized SAM-binding protein YcdF (DUF218 family)
MVLSGAVLFFAVWWFWQPIGVRVGEWLIANTPAKTADLVVALGGDHVRQEVAAALLKDGVAQWIMFVGADIRAHDYTCLDVPQDRILHQPRPAYTTFEEATNAREIVKEHRLRNLIVVTSPHHLRRTLWTFRHVFGKSDVEVFGFPTPNRAFSAHNWWKTHIGRKSVISEYIGLIYNWFVINMESSEFRFSDSDQTESPSFNSRFSPESAT